MTIAEESPSTEALNWHRIRWPALVVALLFGHAFIVTGALLLSSTWIPGASVAPPSYASDLKWDELQALRSESQQLGWTLEVTPTDATELNGDRRVRFALRDARSKPIHDASLCVAIYHHSRPNQPIELGFEPAAGEPLIYERALDIDREGLWHLSATAERGWDRFLVETDFWIGKPARGAE